MSIAEPCPTPQPVPSPSRPSPAPRLTLVPDPAEASFTDGPTVRVPAVPALPGVPAFTAVPPQADRTPRNRPHRAQAGELAALAFAVLPAAIPAQRGPSEL